MVRVKRSNVLIAVSSSIFLILLCWNGTVLPSANEDIKLNLYNFNANTIASREVPWQELNKECLFFPDSPQAAPNVAPAADLGCDRYPQNWLYLDSEARLQLTEHGIEKVGEDKIKCDLSYFSVSLDNFLDWFPVGPVEIGFPVNTDNGDFIEVQCCAGAVKRWRHIFMTVSPREEVFERRSQSQIGGKKVSDKLNVYWIGFDSLAEAEFPRFLPRTLQYFEEVMQAVTMRGFHAVGFDTAGGYFPLLIGQKPILAKDAVAPVWNDFADAGYVTLLAENAPTASSIYTELARNKVPWLLTDHSLRAFYHEAEKRFLSRHCFGSEAEMDVWLRFVTEMFSKYPNEIGKFLVTHHSRLSRHSPHMLTAIDEMLRLHLKLLHDRGFLDDTVVFLGSVDGRQANQRPFLSVFLPVKLRQSAGGREVVENLRVNARRLSTPFDVHATFLDLLTLSASGAADWRSPDTSFPGRSLLRPIEEARTCPAAGVPWTLCQCFQWRPLPPPSTQTLGQVLVGVLNRFTQSVRNSCTELRLEKVLTADRVVVSGESGGGAKVEAVRLRFLASPSSLFEALIDANSPTTAVDVDVTQIRRLSVAANPPKTCLPSRGFLLAELCVCL